MLALSAATSHEQFRRVGQLFFDLEKVQAINEQEIAIVRTRLLGGGASPVRNLLRATTSRLTGINTGRLCVFYAFDTRLSPANARTTRLCSRWCISHRVAEQGIAGIYEEEMANSGHDLPQARHAAPVSRVRATSKHRGKPLTDCLASADRGSACEANRGRARLCSAAFC